MYRGGNLTFCHPRTLFYLAQAGIQASSRRRPGTRNKILDSGFHNLRVIYDRNDQKRNYANVSIFNLFDHQLGSFIHALKVLALVFRLKEWPLPDQQEDNAWRLDRPQRRNPI